MIPESQTLTYRNLSLSKILQDFNMVAVSVVSCTMIENETLTGYQYV